MSRVTELIDSLQNGEFTERRRAVTELEELSHIVPDKIVENVEELLKVFDRDPNEIGVQGARNLMVSVTNDENYREVAREIIEYLSENDDRNAWKNSITVLSSVWHIIEERDRKYIKRKLLKNENWVHCFPIEPAVSDGLFLSLNYSQLALMAEPDEFFPAFENRLDESEELGGDVLKGLLHLLTQLGNENKRRLAMVVSPHLTHMENTRESELGSSTSMDYEEWVEGIIISHLPKDEYPVGENCIYSVIQEVMIGERLSNTMFAEECLVSALEFLGQEHVEEFRETWCEHPEEGTKEQAERIVGRVESKLWTEERLINIDPLELEVVVADLWEKKGYRTEMTEKSGDKGTDVIAEGDGKIVIQVKRYKNNVQSFEVRQMPGAVKIRDADKGILVTTSGFTGNSRDEAEKMDSVRLINGDELLTMLQRHGISPREYT